MKSSNKIRIGFFCFLLSVLVGACSKMDATYKQFLENGMKIYVGMVDSVFVYPGSNRIQLGWLPPSDPKATLARVYWNNRTDSVDVPMRTESRDTIKVMLDNFDEGTYIFEVLTYDDENHVSLKKEIVVRVYGDRYQNTLLSRVIDSYEIDDENRLNLVWGALPDPAVYGSEFIYKDENDMTRRLFVAANDGVTQIENFHPQTIEHRTLYLPTTLAIDTFYTAYESQRIKGGPIELSKAGWTAEASTYDSNGNRPASNAIDNNPSTLWVNRTTNSPSYPHTITVDMGVIHDQLEGFAIITRVGDAAARPKTVELYTSLDGENWILHVTTDLENTGDTQFIALNEPVNARYFRLIGKNAYNGGNNIALAEIGMYIR